MSDLSIDELLHQYLRNELRMSDEIGVGSASGMYAPAWAQRDQVIPTSARQSAIQEGPRAYERYLSRNNIPYTRRLEDNGRTIVIQAQDSSARTAYPNTEYDGPMYRVDVDGEITQEPRRGITVEALRELAEGARVGRGNPFADIGVERATVPTPVTTMTPEEMQASEADAYIMYMAKSVNLDLNKVSAIKPELIEIFKSQGRTGINKILLDESKWADLKAKPITTDINPEHLNLLVDFEKVFANTQIADRLRNLNNDITNYASTIEDYFNSIDGYLKEITRRRVERDALTQNMNSSGVLQEATKKILARGLEMHSIDQTTGKIAFRTPEIILSYFNREAGISQAVTMGRYLIEASLPHYTVKVLGFEKNITSRSFLHPHVSTRGEVCFGNAKTRYLEGVKKADLFQVIDTAYAVLCEYNVDSPYEDLSNFWNIRNPESLKRRPHVWQRYHSTISALASELPVTPHPGDIDEEWEDDDTGETRYRIRPYFLVYQGTSSPVLRDPADESSENFAVRAGNNRYVEVERDMMDNWDW